LGELGDGRAENDVRLEARAVESGNVLDERELRSADDRRMVEKDHPPPRPGLIGQSPAPRLAHSGVTALLYSLINHVLLATMNKLFTVMAIAGVAGVTALSAALGQESDPAASVARRAGALSAEPGDRVWLHVWREPLLSDTVTVDENGNVLLPKIGVLRTSGLPISALRDTIRARFSEFLRDSPVDVVVLRRVAVNGAVAKPDVYYVDLTTTLRDAIARAGGIAPDGDDGKVAVIRQGQRIPIPNWQSDVSTSSDLRSGDQVVVGRKSWIQMNFLSALSVATVALSVLYTISHK
jgi:polysaccharide export outer membrane protein